jgi:hypothetical protein
MFWYIDEEGIVHAYCMYFISARVDLWILMIVWIGFGTDTFVSLATVLDRITQSVYIEIGQLRGERVVPGGNTKLIIQYYILASC